MSIWSTFCDAVTFPGSVDEPPEMCADDVAPDSDKCARHTDYTDPDAARDWANEQAMENES